MGTMKQILVIEDEHSLLQVIQRKLELSGFMVITARSVAQALDEISRNPDIKAIWLDHYLFGEENGLDLLAKLKKDDKTKTIPIFVVSNTASPEKVHSYLRLGVEKYYTKSDHALGEIIEDINKVIKV